jgi:hypothetical protein
MTMRLLRAILVATLVHVAATESSVVLTKKTFEKLTEGKTVFIKFFAPWYVRDNAYDMVIHIINRQLLANVGGPRPL